MGGPETTRMSASAPSGTVAPRCRQRSLGSAVGPLDAAPIGAAPPEELAAGIPPLRAPPISPIPPAPPLARDGAIAVVAADAPAPAPVGSTSATEADAGTGTRISRNAAGSAR